MNSQRRRIVQHSFGEIGTGGPIGALKRVMESDLAERFEFTQISQTQPAGGINLPLIIGMARKFKAFRSDLVHVRGLGNEGFHGVVAARLAGAKKILLSIHGSQTDLPATGQGRLRRAMVTKILEPLSLRLATHVYVVCEDGLKRPILNPVRQKIVGVVANGVDAPLFDGTERAKVRSEIDVSTDEVVIVIVARMVIEKGYLDLIDAARVVATDTPHRPTFLLVGDGPDRKKIEDCASLVRGARFISLGRRLDVADILAAADIFVLPSHLEGMSNALLEAMSSGLPAVASTVGGNPEVLRGGGGILVPPRDPEALARALTSLVSSKDLRKSLGQDARNNVRAHYTVAHMTSRLGEVYDEIIGQP